MGPRHRRVVWSDGALLEVEEALSYVATESPRAAARLVGQILAAAESLSTLSERGRVVPERGDPTIRELIVQPFRLIYHVAESEIVVLGLLHHRRDWSEPDRDEPVEARGRHLPGQR